MRISHRKIIIASSPLFAPSFASQDRPRVSGAPQTLEEMSLGVERGFPEVAHLRAGDLAERLAGPQTIPFFGVREIAEFDVSHLRRAERMAPSAQVLRAPAQICDCVSGAVIVCYCSVGQRSSRLASRVQQALFAHEVCPFVICAVA